MRSRRTPPPFTSARPVRHSLLQPRSRHRQRHPFLRQRQNKVSASKHLAITLGRVPHRSYFHFSVTFRDFSRLTALFVHVRFDYLGCDASSELPMLPTF